MIDIPLGRQISDAYIQPLWIVNTKNPETKEPNGYIRNIVNPNLGEEFGIDQVYITYCVAGIIKGPHMHWGNKTDRFYCVGGRVALICRNEQTQQYKEFELEAHDDQLVIIPPYNSHALVALGGISAAVLSIPTEGYKPGEVYNQVETIYENYSWDMRFNEKFT